MGFWPFGQKPADVETLSRVVTADTRDRRRVRGKLTVHFTDPQKQDVADRAADVCASIAGTILREAESHEQVIGAEEAVVKELGRRLPPDMTPTRSIELVALHIVGDLGTSAARRPSGGGLATVTPSPVPVSVARIPTPAPSPAGILKTPPLPEAVAPSLSSRPPTGRGSSARMRVVNLVIPPGTSVMGIGASLAPLVHDAATRLLVAMLRTYDLIVVRRVDLDDGGAELAALVPAPDAPLGGFEASRAQELARWQTTLGGPAFAALRREAVVFTVFFAYSAMLEVNVPQPVAVPIIESICASAFAHEAPPQAELGRYLHLVEATLVDQLAKYALAAVGAPPVAQARVARALAPVLAALQDEMSFGATLVRHASTA